MYRTTHNVTYHGILCRLLKPYRIPFGHVMSYPSNRKPEHTTGESVRAAHSVAARQNGAGRNADRAIRPEDRRSSYPIPPGIEDTSSERLSRSTNKRNLCKSNAGTKSAVDERFIRGLSAAREALFVSGCRPEDRRLFISVNPFSYNACSGMIFYLSSPKPGHTTCGSCRCVRRDGRIEVAPTDLFA